MKSDKKCCLSSHRCLEIIQCILLCVSLFALVVSLCILVYNTMALCKAGYTLNLSISGIKNFFEPIQSSSWVFEITFIGISAWCAIKSLVHSANTHECEVLLSIRKELNTPNNLEIHENLRGNGGKWVIGLIPDENETWLRIDNYLGTLEFCYILIEKGIITELNFESQYGYRVRNVVKNKQICHKIHEEEGSWDNLIKLFDIVTGCKQIYESNKTN